MKGLEWRVDLKPDGGAEGEEEGARVCDPSPRWMVPAPAQTGKQWGWGQTPHPAGSVLVTTPVRT